MCNEEHNICTCPASERYKCHKADLAIFAHPLPTDTPYVNEPFSVTCCVNMDPRATVDKVWLVHNDTIELASLQTPHDRGLSRLDEAQLEKCWYYNVTRVKMRDSGEYKCVAKRYAPFDAVNVHSPKLIVQVRGRAD